MHVGVNVSALPKRASLFKDQISLSLVSPMM